jgi:broad specificity phosphatase PhoE
MTRFCLIRHGQTDWNLEGRYQGQSDVPLNLVGREQAHTLARQLSGQSFSAIFSSDLIRAKETADILASVLKAPVIVDSRLREINQGEWEGQLVEVLKAKYNGLWEMRTVDPAGVRPPGGETVGEVAARMYAAMDDIANQFPEGEVLIISHGLALATVICKAKGMKVGQAYRVIPGNAEPVWVTWPVPGG